MFSGFGDVALTFHDRRSGDFFWGAFGDADFCAVIAGCAGGVVDAGLDSGFVDEALLKRFVSFVKASGW